MPEWLIEKGIGETRAALVENGRIIEARIELDGSIPAGTILAARLTNVGSAGRNGTARDESGTDYLLPYVPRDVPEGSAINIEVTRPALPGPEPWKRPIAKATRDERRRPRSLAERLRETDLPLRDVTLPAARDELAEAGWWELIDEARTGRVEFAGGTLGIFFTPAMTLIDVDGRLGAAELAEAGARAGAQAVRRLDVGGSIGIDLPTVTGKAARLKAAAAVDEILPQPFERTAVNGFGFLQVVRQRTRASLLELAHDRAGFEARALLRRLAFEGGGARRIVANPAVVTVLEANPDWLKALELQVGGAVSLQRDSSLPIDGGYAEKP